MRWSLQDCRMVGSMCSLRSSAPFARDAVVLTNEAVPDAYLILGREHADGSVEGERMTAAEWGDLLACEEALAFAAPIEAGRNAKCWVLRASFRERDRAATQLRAQAGAILHEEAREGVLIVVVDESRAGDPLERWSRDAFDQAWRLGQHGEWDDALAHADLAWLTDCALNLDRVALLALAFEHVEGPSAAEDLIAFETNSRGGRSERELRELIADYRKQFALAPRLAPLVLRMRELESRSVIGDIGAWQAKRATTDWVFPLPRAVARSPVPRPS